MNRWREIPGFSGYEVSDDGQVRRHISKPWKGHYAKKPGELLKAVSHKGYVMYCLMSDSGKIETHPVSRFVALAFHGACPSSKHGALHKDDNRKNNHYTNIYWGTSQQNVNDRGRNGHTYRRFGTKDLAAIKHAVAKGRSINSIAKEYSADWYTIKRALVPKGEDDD